tara:strand:+ start:337 stop:513 length:177 start_codon:yes stop_codon:yes gene_type:complete
MSWEADYWNKCMRDNDMDVDATIKSIQGLTLSSLLETHFCFECLEEYDEEDKCECMED